MKLKKVALQNVRSFADRQEFDLDGNISILIGPNGGGKTNLLDTIVLSLRQHLIKSWEFTEDSSTKKTTISLNQIVSSQGLEKHSQRSQDDQIIEFTIQITQPDIDNMKYWVDNSESIIKNLGKEYMNLGAYRLNREIVNTLAPDETFVFEIKNSVLMGDEPDPMSYQFEQLSVEPTDKRYQFRKYLTFYEIITRLSQEESKVTLSTPMMLMPVARAHGGNLGSSVILSQYSGTEHKRILDAASSKSPVSQNVGQLAIGTLVEMLSELTHKYGNEPAMKALRDKESIDSFTKTLEMLGYEWDLKCTNTKTNAYELKLKKQGAEFSLETASSGERELLTYLFAIYVLNLKDALIVIDEPELHLHPKWQRKLIELFEKLADETNNQFVMATHSPAFITPASIGYVSRVFSESQESKIVRLKHIDDFEKKHLFHMVNSQNNERIFFSDLVILVEGISDKIFFEALFKAKGFDKEINKTYEIISVGGKGLFKQYQSLLTGCGIAYVVIADLDYAKDVGTPEVKELFDPNVKKIKNTLNYSFSLDAKNFVREIDSFINKDNKDGLEQVWEHIKSRQSSHKQSLSEEQKMTLCKFIKGQRVNDSIIILSKGQLEDYLPSNCKSKDVEEVIKFTQEVQSYSHLLGELKQNVIEEINMIVDYVEARISPKQ
ncbi:AAA family ATPase [Formosimonas limnophila]|uniref:AAA family ATPase n=1 Tax=Formosimonas limnophila TaxID=1384487 RepID=UPI0016718ABB|nr:AAA family ATPase [Formosimonas limnophila]